jgi:uncharacterized protein YidB (DUF937 family)
MGLLDDLLGQLAAGGAPQQQRQAPPAQASSGMGMGSILMALMPVVLMMLRSRGGNDPSAGFGRASASGGGLGDILGQVLGSAAGGGGGGLGGLGALLEQFQRAGFGDAARSWVSSGDNQPMPPGALEQVFGPGGLAEIARRAGLSEADTSRGLAQLMPEVINHVTPQGAVPQGDDLLASVDALARRLGMS